MSIFIFPSQIWAEWCTLYTQYGVLMCRRAEPHSFSSQLPESSVAFSWAQAMKGTSRGSPGSIEVGVLVLVVPFLAEGSLSLPCLKPHLLLGGPPLLPLQAVGFRGPQVTGRPHSAHSSLKNPVIQHTSITQSG